ncbi:unnamed protein product [Adineta steineri]|uniref:F-box domain-containing protein n=1 Tax=Adineta steineri TaxID=433720 RepID=A0A819EB53_9BILA|nr:unnamed protein product [Adineta steineri]
MEQIKRQLCDNFEENKRKKFITKSDCNVTQIEDLANELLYDIFEYLNSYNIYQSFFRLNHRFRSLLVESFLPLEIHIPLISSSSFDSYNQDMIMPNKQRIHSIKILNSFMYDDEVLSLLNKISLRTLILENIESNRLRNLLNQLTSLSYLSSLSIITVDQVPCKNYIYREVFHLPSLRYCRLSLGNHYSLYLSTSPVNEQSSIEHLIIDYEIKDSELNNFLSCVPQLRRFSLKLSKDYGSTSTNIPCYVLNNLIHLSLKFSYNITFALLEYIFINHFPFIEILCISGNLTSIDANKWRQLISMHLLKLRIFDVMFEIVLYNDNQKAEYEEQVKLFQSSFWIERQWFFHSRLDQKLHSNRRILFTINPYRRKNYELHSEVTAENENQIIFKSVDLVQIQNEMAINQCMDYFPNTTQLTLSDGFSISTYRSIESGLNRILPLQQIKTLVIQCHHFSFLKMIKLLSYIPNLDTLTFQTMPLFKENKVSIEQNEEFQSLCKTNCVTTVTFRQICILDKVQILIILFPHLQHLVMNIQMKDMELILRFLLNKNNHDLVLLSFKPASGVYFAHLNHLIKSGALSSDHRRLHAYKELCLWCVSKFEDLANELIYEIFEYLDYYHSYQEFFDLKYRFRSLFTQSTVPFKINIDFISQSNFNSFNQDIIIPYRQRIHSLRLSNYFIFDSNPFVLSDKKFLQTLVIENLEPLDLPCILHQLKLLSNLSSLTFTTIDFVINRNYIYQLIFQLPLLRYCKLSLGGGSDINILPITTDEYSSIELFIIICSTTSLFISTFITWIRLYTTEFT